MTNSKSEMTCFSLLTGVLLGEHGRLTVAKSDLELVTGGSYILNTTIFLASDIFLFTVKVLSDGINSIGSSACENLSFFQKIPAKITFALAFKTALLKCGF